MWKTSGNRARPGRPVSSATYRNNLATLFDQTRAEALWETQGLSYQEILVQLAQ